MRNKKGFTLIEMLIVITLMAILMTIAIPSVLRIMESRSNDEYRYQVKLVEQAVNLYQTRYKGEFNNNSQASCFILDYQTLLDEELLEEQDISCSGKIVLTRNSKNNLNKSYYLKCVDSNNVEFSSYKQSDIPSGCIVLGTEYDDDASAITAPTIKGGNGNWVPTNIDITVEDSGISSSDVNYYEYYISSISTTPSKNVEVTGRTSNKVTISDEGTTYIWYRVIDKSGNVSNWSNRQVANIDKTTPTAPTITASDGIASGTLHQAEFVLTFGGGTNVSGNTYYYGTSTNPTTLATAINVTASDNNKRIYVKSCNGANICSETSSYVIKITIPEVVDPALVE